MVNKVPRDYDFYCCYLLRSINKPKSFYIGSTPDPWRRLRQHNGLLTSGLYKTKRQGFRPWKCVMIVYGFPNKITLLLFEHLWQHPYQTRHIKVEDRITKTRTSGAGISHRVSNAKLLLKSDFFNNLDLKIHIFDKDIYETWKLNRFKILWDGYESRVDYDELEEQKLPQEALEALEPDGNYDQVLALLNKVREQEDLLFENVKKQMIDKLNDEGNLCEICEDNIYLEAQGVDDSQQDKGSKEPIGICYYCYRISHLRCMAELRSGIEILPKDTICSGCGQNLKWSQVARLSKMTRIWMSGSIVDNAPTKKRATTRKSRKTKENSKESKEKDITQ